jgi:hypothetical protein
VNSNSSQCQQLLQRAGHVINTTKALWRITT